MTNITLCLGENIVIIQIPVSVKLQIKEQSEYNGTVAQHYQVMRMW